MLDTEKKKVEEEKEEEEHTSSSNNENDFQELDNEIEKVVRGETSYEEDKTDLNKTDLNNSQNSYQIYSKLKNNFYMNKTNNNNNIANNNEDEKQNLNNINYNKESFQNKLNSLNLLKKCVVNEPMNFEKPFFSPNNCHKNDSNDLNLNNFENNSKIKKNHHKNKKYNKKKKNTKINPIKNNNNNAMNNINISPNNNSNCNLLNELISKNANNFINNNMNINDIKLFNYINNINSNQNNNNFDILNNLNINNNNQLLQNLNNHLYSSQFPNNSLNNNNNMCNNTIITNQIITPININLQLPQNNNIDSNQYCKLLNNLNNRCNSSMNGLNNIINYDLSHYLQINNSIPQSGIHPYNNTDINIQYKNNETVMLNNFVNQLNNSNIMDLVVNNILNKSQTLNDLNNNCYINNNNNFKNVLMNSIGKNISVGNSNNFIKRRLFNPLSDLEKEKNIINLMDIIQCKDMRTTLMIKNIPNKYTISSFLEEINENFKNTYDIFYLPIDYINKCNLGFAFINFVEPFHIILFYELFRGKKWKKFNSEKICELLYAKYQGRKELINHFEKGKVLTFESEDKRPLILPEPHQFPKINIPLYYLDLFIKNHPHTPYKIKNINNKKNNNPISKIFSINGNFHKNKK